MLMAKSDGSQRTAESPRTWAHYVSSDERRAKGKALRGGAPRSSHAGWEPPKDRRDPVEIVRESNKGRVPELIPIRMGRMAQSPFAFFRGAAALMAADLATTPVSGLRVQACGDAHLANFGGFATAERNIIFDINDFDETLPGPWEWDLKRLAASVVIAAQDAQYRDSDAARMAVRVARAYREQMADYASMRALDVWYDHIDTNRFVAEAESEIEKRGLRKHHERLIEAARRKSTPEHLFPKLVESKGTLPKLKDEPPLLFHPTRTLLPGAASGYRESFEIYRESLPEHLRALIDRFTFCDLALKVVGVGSVGTRCSVMLLMAGEDDPLFLQVKEASASVLEPYAGKSAHPNHGQRIVVGQRLMQAASDMLLGWTVGKDGHDFYVRQLRDAKISGDFEGENARLLPLYTRMCARTLARAHARSGDAGMMSGYIGSGGTFDDAIAEFAVEYADQNRQDHRAFVRAIKEGRIKATTEE